MINRRPISFKDGLRSLPLDELPQPITPEMLIKGFETASINVIPELQSKVDEIDPDFGSPSSIDDAYKKLRSARDRLMEVYHREFLANLLYQAVDRNDRYKRVIHQKLKPGDIVLICDKHLKQSNYPLGRIISVEENSLGEVTAAHILKGATKEKIYRHATSLIMYIPVEQSSEGTASKELQTDSPSHSSPNEEDQSITSLGQRYDRTRDRSRPMRATARKCNDLIREIRDSL